MVFSGLNFKLISPGVLETAMNKKIRNLDINEYPDMAKFHKSPAEVPKKASDMIYKNYDNYFNGDKLEIDLRNEKGW